MVGAASGFGGEGGSRWRLGAGAAVVLVLGAVAGGVVQQVAQDVAPPPVAVSAAPAVTSAASLIVDVQGAVASPGVYTLPEGARVLDAIARAGGAAEGAAPGGLNLARPVVDGEQLLVPTEEEAAAGAAGTPAMGGPGGLVSLNRADAATLETLPRVGPALAGAILAHREEHGPFTDVAQLDDVPGIGPALLAQLTPLVTL
ncbi:ComEA family DNA-binding protein [Agrococcus sp. SL85]|uniref:ComEA family DNA-binding protein n=1 Tax=Agrococcus sp. SL85 TaxID=2995141 RepID=UPI00226CEEE7|nr:ComEA family DNA-binding protein [Agrococcus sp. SL85]WAC65701.1 ComEA family DNA-binding protein [Agrococcus sp. SL85]